MGLSARVVGVGIAIPLAFVTLASACAYDWRYDEDALGDGGSAKAKKEGGGSEEETGSPTTGECSPTLPCKEGTCAFADGNCGRTSPEGKCVDVSAKCENKPVCTCAGEKTTDCEASKLAKTIDESGQACAGTGGGDFKCGVEICKGGTQYCYMKKASSATACMDFKAGCSASCKCPDLPTAPCTCETDGLGNVIITC